MEQWYKCPQCDKDLIFGVNPCPHCKCLLAWSLQGPLLYIPPSESLGPQVQKDSQTIVVDQRSADIPKTDNNKKISVVMIALSVIVISFIAMYIFNSNSSSHSTKTDSTPTAPQRFSSQATLTESESTYRLQVRENLKIIALGMGSIAEMLKAPRFGNKDWETLLVVRLAAFKVMAEDGKKIEAPASMVDEQNEYIQALDHCINCVNLTVRALDTYNSDYMYQANDEINLAGEHFSKFISMIE